MAEELDQPPLKDVYRKLITDGETSPVFRKYSFTSFRDRMLTNPDASGEVADFLIDRGVIKDREEWKRDWLEPSVPKTPKPVAQQPPSRPVQVPTLLQPAQPAQGPSLTQMTGQQAMTPMGRTQMPKFQQGPSLTDVTRQQLTTPMAVPQFQPFQFESQAEIEQAAKSPVFLANKPAMAVMKDREQMAEANPLTWRQDETTGKYGVFEKDAPFESKPLATFDTMNQAAAAIKTRGAASDGLIFPTKEAEQEFQKLSPDQQQATIEGSTGAQFEQNKKNEERTFAQKYGIGGDFDKTMGELGLQIGASTLEGIKDYLKGGEHMRTMEYLREMQKPQNVGRDVEVLKEIDRKQNQALYDAQKQISERFDREIKKNNISTDAFKNITEGNWERVPESVLYTVGSVIMQVAPSIATYGTSTYFQTLPQVYKAGVDARAKELGITPEEVIRSGQDGKTMAKVVGLTQAALERVGAGMVSSSIAKQGGYTAVRDWVIGKLGKSTWSKAAGRGAGLGFASGGEGFTGLLQEVTSVLQEGKMANKGILESFEGQGGRILSAAGNEAIGGFGAAGLGRAFAGRGNADSNIPPPPPTSLGGIQTQPVSDGDVITPEVIDGNGGPRFEYANSLEEIPEQYRASAKKRTVRTGMLGKMGIGPTKEIYTYEIPIETVDITSPQTPVAPVVTPEAPISEPTQEQIDDDIKNKRFGTFNYETEDQVPDELKDKIRRGEIDGKPFIKVTLPLSQAEYLYSKRQPINTSEQPVAPTAEQELAEINARLNQIETEQKDGAIGSAESGEVGRLKARKAELETSVTPVAPTNQGVSGETVDKTTGETKTGVTFENAKEGDVVFQAGKPVTVVGRTKSRAGRDVIEVQEAPRTKEEIKQAALQRVFNRVAFEYGNRRVTWADIEANHPNEVRKAIEEEVIVESSRKGTFTIDAEQWANEVTSTPEGPVVTPESDTTFVTVTDDELNAFKQGQVNPERLAGVQEDADAVRNGEMTLEEIEDPNYRTMVQMQLEADKQQLNSSVGKTFTLKDTERISDGTGLQRKGSLVNDPELVAKQLSVGDKLTFFQERERTGTWDGNKIIEDGTNNPWGLLGVLSDGWVINNGQQANDNTNAGTSQSVVDEGVGQRTGSENVVTDAGVVPAPTGSGTGPVLTEQSAAVPLPQVEQTESAQQGAAETPIGTPQTPAVLYDDKTADLWLKSALQNFEEKDVRLGKLNELEQLVRADKRLNPQDLTASIDAINRERDRIAAPNQSPADQIADLRAKEQAEYDAMPDPKDKAKRKEIYDRYDKPISDLLAQQEKEEEKGTDESFTAKGGNKVVDEEGQPIIVYHGTTRGGFSDFSPEGAIKSGNRGGIFFTDNRNVAQAYEGSGSDVEIKGEYFDKDAELEKLNGQFGNNREFKDENPADGLNAAYRNLTDSRSSDFEKKLGYDSIKKITGNKKLADEYIAKRKILSERESNTSAGIYSARINIQNPLVVDFKGKEWNDGVFEGKKVSTNDLTIIALKRGHDGVIIKNVIDIGGAGKVKFKTKAEKVANVYVVFDKKNIDLITKNQTAQQGEAAATSPVAAPAPKAEPVEGGGATQTQAGGNVQGNEKAEVKPVDKATVKALLVEANDEYDKAKAAFDKKKAELNKTTREDTPDLFGKREVESGLFEMPRISPQQREKAIQPFRDRFEKAKKEVNRLTTLLNKGQEVTQQLNFENDEQVQETGTEVRKGKGGTKDEGPVRKKNPPVRNAGRTPDAIAARNIQFFGDPYYSSLQYMMDMTYHPDLLQSIFGGPDKNSKSGRKNIEGERKPRIQFLDKKSNIKTADRLGELLAEKYAEDNNMTVQEAEDKHNFRDIAETIILNHSSRNQMVKAILDQNDMVEEQHKFQYDPEGIYGEDFNEDAAKDVDNSLDDIPDSYWEGMDLTDEQYNELFAPDEPTPSTFTAFDTKGEAGRKAREALKEEVGPEEFRRMDNIHRNGEKMLKELQTKGILEIRCP